MRDFLGIALVVLGFMFLIALWEGLAGEIERGNNGARILGFLCSLAATVVIGLLCWLLWNH